MQLLVDFFALAIVDAYLSGFYMVARKSKPNLIFKGIGKGHDWKWKKNFLRRGNSPSEKSLAEVSSVSSKSSLNAALADRLLYTQVWWKVDRLGSHGTDGLVAQGLGLGGFGESEVKKA